ncbi:LOW QUALITY PROTEIN: hypothetical protein CVT25_002568 [Psilocybe cyanescens]|uniref:Uncharacterized protein n=1 Tax=Psilocybe cyanescens TaxID=93625 RepID=A0A409WLE2_PSICY|nr:LOW QUALITY PROTEIN: hypothetical protein CVT25_002568 [Psilocybe cyanescens]
MATVCLLIVATVVGHLSLAGKAEVTADWRLSRSLSLASEHLAAITVSSKDKLKLSLGATISSSISLLYIVLCKMEIQIGSKVFILMFSSELNGVMGPNIARPLT